MEIKTKMETKFQPGTPKKAPRLRQWTGRTMAGLSLLLFPVLLSLTPAGQMSQGAGRIAATCAGRGLSSAIALYGDSGPEELVLKEALDVLEKSSSRYFEVKKFSIDVEYSVCFNSEDFDRPDDRKTGRIVRHKDNFFQDEMGNIRVINKDYELLINERAEFMTIRNRMDEGIRPVNFEADSLAPYVAMAEKTEIGFRYYFDEGPVEKLEIAVDEEGYLDTWRTWYRDPMDFGDGEVKVVTQMRYLNFEKNPKTDPAIFSVERFLSIAKSGEVTAKGKYKNYYVLNQLVRK